MYREDMKPCPFCGGKPELILLGMFKNSNECFVKCNKCKIEQGHMYMSKQAAITAWNRRIANADK